jgi:hypothetical protein
MAALQINYVAISTSLQCCMGVARRLLRCRLEAINHICRMLASLALCTSRRTWSTEYWYACSHHGGIDLGETVTDELTAGDSDLQHLKQSRSKYSMWQEMLRDMDK